jgi:tRNA threonylcarbamoyl adenosine modification protein (Sua5/YciO/YrdC/YwlC family)
MLLSLHPDNPPARSIRIIADTLARGGIIIYPTDTIYGLGCDIFQPRAIEKICRLKQIDPRKAQLSFVCADLSDLSEYAKQLSRSTYRLLNEHLPGPYTFILAASKSVPKILKGRKDTIGLRIPANKISIAIARELGHPLLSASLPGNSVEEYTDPELMQAKFAKEVDIVVDGGIGGTVPSTIVDCTLDEPVVLRQGAGKWEE